jgi:hypothetical protein
MTCIKVSVGSPNGDGKRPITYRLGEAEYSDSVDVASGWQRQQSLKRALPALGIDPDGLQYRGHGQAESNLSTLESEIARLAKEADAKAASERNTITYRRITCAELDAGDYQLEYLINNTLVAGQPCGVAGPKKSLKTSLLIDLGISLAMGGCFLGKLRVNRACRVGIMTGESGLATIQETARRICTAAGHNLRDISGLVFSDQLPRFGSFEHQEAVRRFANDDELDVLGIDPAYLCMPGADAGNYFIQGELLRGMGEVCSSVGCMMMLAVHNKKGKADPYAPPELEDIAWAGFQEYFRQWLLLGRREAYEPGTGDHRLWLVPTARRATVKGSGGV